MTTSPVTYETRDGVARITLNRPDVLNALDADLALALADHAAAAAADPHVMLVVVAGAGRAFCSGMDRTALADGRIGEAFYRHWIRALNSLEDMPKIVLAVLHGYALGGGLQLALACDLRLATEDAVIGLGATRHGLIPDGAVLRLARVVGLGRAKELALLNDTVTPAEARSMGLVNWVCRDRGRRSDRRGSADQGPQRRPHGRSPYQAAASRLLPRRSPSDDRDPCPGAARLHGLLGDRRGEPRVAGAARGGLLSAPARKRPRVVLRAL